MRVGEGDFLLGLAGVSATLLGTFIVGVFFYIESGLHRRLSGSIAAHRYLRSGMRWVFAAYSLPLLVALTNAAVVVAVVLPWVIGGWVPAPSAFIPSLLIVLAAGFASTVALVMAEFDATTAVTESPDQKAVDPGR